MEEELEREQKHGLTISQLPLIVRTLHEDASHSGPIRQTPHFPFYRRGQEHRGVE